MGTTTTPKTKLHHFKQIENFWQNVIFFHKGGGGTPFAEDSAKIIYLIFEPFPNLIIHVLVQLPNGHMIT